MGNLIDRQAAIEAVNHICPVDTEYDCTLLDRVDVRCVLLDLPSAERKKGRWTERHHAYSDEEQPIEEWQSCKCSECGRYDTRPYLYYFSEPRFCSWCGAEMVLTVERGEE